MGKFEGKWGNKKESFQDICNDILRNDSNLESFKRHPGYIYYIGNDVRKVHIAIQFYNYIFDNYGFLFDKWNSFIENDKLGSPMLYSFREGVISPGTLRFMKVLGDIMNNFDFSFNNIVEIGSGYGGQCKIIDCAMKLDSYTLIDIPESLAIAKLYLSKLNVENKLIYQDTDNIKPKEEYDLAISDYCLSELDDEGIEFYTRTILSKCKYGYFTMNIFDDNRKILVRKILSTVFSEIKEFSEEPKTSHHNNYILICKR